MDNAVKIRRVYLDDLTSDGEPDVTMAIHLDNGQRITLNLNEIANDPRYADCVSSDHSSDPQTDGVRLFWADGRSVTLSAILEAIVSDSGGVIAEVEAYEGQADEIDVTLTGGHMISLSLAPEYKEGGAPQTDGARVSWQNGLSLTLDEILELVYSE